MKIIFFALFFVITSFVISASAQSVVVTPRKITYTRPKPISSYKKTFSIRYPKIKAATPALSKKIEDTISYARILEINLKEELGKYQWLESADYEVAYNDKNILTIILSMEGSAAYPSGRSEAVVVDIVGGNRIMPADAFVNLTGLAAMVKKSQAAEVENALKELKADPENKDVDVNVLFENTDFTEKDLEHFSVDASGVTFIYDYGFAHAIQALQPEGRYKFTWMRLRPHVSKNGPFTVFLK